MNRNLKVLGIAMAAVFAFSAVAASAASAQNGTLTSDGPVKVTGVNNAGVNQLNAFGGVVTCPNAKYTGFKYNTTPHELIPNDVSTFTVEPEYGVCNTNFGINFPTTVDMNGCDYNFHLGETVGTDKYGVKVTIVCSGSHIKVTQYASATRHSEGKSFCAQTIEEEAEREYEGLTATDNTNGTGTIEGKIEGIHASSSGSFPCPNTSTTIATLELHINVTGDNAEGGSTEIGISHS